MEDEIDLRPYVRAILRRWPLILACALTAVAVAVGLTLATPPSSRASASVLIAPTVSQISFDPRFVTRDATMLTSAANQRQALLALATSTALEMRVAAELGEPPPAPGALLGRVSVATDGDLLEFTARGPDEQAATRLAEAWARSYEQLIAEIYSRDTAGVALIDAQLVEARQRYDQAQAELEQFLGQSELVTVQQQIDSITALLSGSTESEAELYGQYLQRSREMDLIIADARALRAQLDDQADDSLATSLALLALRARVAGGGELPIQLRFDDPAAIGAGGVTIEDLDALIVILIDQRDRLNGEAERLAGQIAEGEGAPIGMDAASRASYQRQLTALNQRVEQIQGLQRSLQQRRDIAFTSLEVLQRKRDEQQIAQAAPAISVRYISTVAAAPSASGSLLIRAALGLVVGALLGAALALWLALVRPGRPRRALPAQDEALPAGERGSGQPAGSS